MCVWAKWHQKSQNSLHKMVYECMIDQKYETLEPISEAVEASNGMKFWICMSLMVDFPFAKKKVWNWKWFLPAYLPMCICKETFKLNCKFPSLIFPQKSKTLSTYQGQEKAYYGQKIGKILFLVKHLQHRIFPTHFINF